MPLRSTAGRTPGCWDSVLYIDVVPQRWAPTMRNCGSIRRPAVTRPVAYADSRATRCAVGEDFRDTVAFFLQLGDRAAVGVGASSRRPRGQGGEQALDDRSYGRYGPLLVGGVARQELGEVEPHDAVGPARRDAERREQGGSCGAQRRNRV